MSRLRIRLSQPNLAEVGVGAELGKRKKERRRKKTSVQLGDT